MRVGKGVYSAGWTFSFSSSIRVGADNKRASNHFILPDLAYDATNLKVHVLTCREKGAGGAAAGDQRWRLDALNTDLTASHNSTRDETPAAGERLAALALGGKTGGRLAVAVAFTDGAVKGYPQIVSGGASYSTFPGTGTTLSSGVADNLERPILACAFEKPADGTDHDVRVYGIASTSSNTWLYDAATPAWGAESNHATPSTMESIEAATAVPGFVFAQLAGKDHPRLRVNADNHLTESANPKVLLPPGAILPFRTSVRSTGPSTSGKFSKGVFVALSDLVAGRVYFVEWDAVPLQPIDLEPASGEIQSTGLVTLKARYRSQEELTGKLVFEIDGDQNFGSIDQTHEATLLADGQMGQVTTTALAEGTWYWRVKGNVGSRGDGVYSTTRSFLVGARLENIRPEDGKAIADDGAPPTSVTLAARVKVLSGVTARAEFEVDKVESFDSIDKQSGQGDYVADGLDSTAAVSLANGVWFLRARAKTLTGSAGPWFPTQGFRLGRTGETRAAGVSAAPYRKMLTEPQVSERGQDRVNRVIVKVRNSAIEVIRQTDPPPAANRRREQAVWLETGDEAVATQVAKDYLDAHSPARKSVESVVIPLTPDLDLSRRVRVILPDGSAATYAIQRIEHHILPDFTTAVSLGDYLPTAEEAIARLADRLERTRSEEKS